MTLSLFIICLVQSITEFLPVSSTAHMILVSKWVSLQDNNILLHVGLHLGTFLAISLYYIRTLTKIIIHFIKGVFIVKKRQNEHLDLGVKIIIATLPAILLGYFLKPYLSTLHDSLFIIGISSILFGALLAYVDDYHPEDRENITFFNAFMIGLGQLFAFLPGGSRLGTTITVARIFGFSRKRAFEFSMLLSLPVVLGAVVLTSYDALRQGVLVFSHEFFILLSVTFVLSFFMLGLVSRFISRIGFIPFGIYRMCLGVVLVIWALLL
jgi:undecaprenyl-diphosphatase